MKYFKLRTICLTLLALTVIKTDSFDGCIIGGGGSCNACYQRNVLENEAGCSKKLPETDRCAIYLYKSQQSVCQLCKPGYALKTIEQPGRGEGGGLAYKCVPGTIKNYVYESVTSSNQHLCTACSAGLYAVPSSTGNSITCQKISNPVPNCVWGSIAVGSSVRCLRCAKGFSASNDELRCEAPSQPGCWIERGAGECLACNPFEGYSSTGQGKCVKDGQVVAKKLH